MKKFLTIVFAIILSFSFPINGYAEGKQCGEVLYAPAGQTGTNSGGYAYNPSGHIIVCKDPSVKKSVPAPTPERKPPVKKSKKK